MAAGGPKRTRSERVAALELPPNRWEQAWLSLHRRDMLARIGMSLVAAVAMCVVIRGWDPPFPYRTGYVPTHDIVGRVLFKMEVPTRTEDARQRARSLVPNIYWQDPFPLEELRAQLRSTVKDVTAAPTLNDSNRRLWSEFQPPPAEGKSPPTETEEQEQFRFFRAAFVGPGGMEQFDRHIADAFALFEQRGLHDKLTEELVTGNPEKILVHPRDLPEPLQEVKVSDVQIGDGTALRQSLRDQFPSREVADRLFTWIRPRLKPTLVRDDAQTAQKMEEAAALVPPVMVNYTAGRTLAKADQPLGADEIQLLKMEDEAALARRSVYQRLSRAVALVAMIFAMFVLCGMYMRYRRRGPPASMARITSLLILLLATVALSRSMSVDPWRAEIIPATLFGMIVAIGYRQEMALLLSGIVAFVLCVASGHGLHEFLLLMGVSTVANLNTGRIRSRSKLIYVGLAAGTVAILLDVALSVIGNQPVSRGLLTGAARDGMWVVVASFLMTGLLPFIERSFGVLTDLSLLELGDVNHPLLQELVRRAPSTYNHSLTVGSIAEAAAESIGARGLLVRVGAYFHDIGKMLKPGYFIENQGSQTSRHESLVPAMSTLVIVAHIKDGANLARQHHLPQPIIDLIAQHHGTTLVEFFFDRAHEQQQADPNGSEVDESIFRYPGPKPQTKEAAVLMLADSVESASRTLVDPAPARIESLVRDIAERRLHGGQFDESGLTLRELRTIEKSLTMSLISIYHGRIKYPEQRTA